MLSVTKKMVTHPAIFHFLCGSPASATKVPANLSANTRSLHHPLSCLAMYLCVKNVGPTKTKVMNASVTATKQMSHQLRGWMYAIHASDVVMPIKEAGVNARHLR